MTPVTLSDEELAQVLARVSPNGREFGAARIVRMLANEHSVQTVRVNVACSVNNISDHVSKCINRRIADLGLYVACAKPPRAILNRFGQPSGQMLWSFYRDVAANDPAYQAAALQDALRRDLSALQADHPQDYQPSLNESADAWEEALGPSEFTSQLDAANESLGLKTGGGGTGNGGA